MGTSEYARARILYEDSANVLEACKLELPALAGKNLLLTGATGFIGGSIVDVLLAFNAVQVRPCRIFLLTRSIERARRLRPDLTGAYVEWIEWPPHGGATPEIDTHIDYVIHAASPTNPSIIAREPVHGAAEMVALTKYLIDLAQIHEVAAFLFLSSGAVYGEQPSELTAVPESYSGAPAVFDTASIYGETKRFCEMLLLQSGVPVILARIFACLGPRQAFDAGFAAPDFFRQALERSKIVIKGDGRALRTFCYISDVVTVLFKLLLAMPKASVCNVGSAGPVVSIEELARMIGEAMGNVDVVVEGATSTGRQRYVPDVSQMEAIYVPQIDLRRALTRIASSMCLPPRP